MRIGLWRGGVDSDLETAPPLDLEAVAAALGRLPDVERAGDDEWYWDAPDAVSAQVVAYSPDDGEPVNELVVTLTFEPGRRADKRAALATLAAALFEAAAASDAVVGEHGLRLYDDATRLVAACLDVDPWPQEPDPPKTHVTRRELFSRFLHRDAP